MCFYVPLCAWCVNLLLHKCMYTCIVSRCTVYCTLSDVYAGTAYACHVPFMSTSCTSCTSCALFLHFEISCARVSSQNLIFSACTLQPHIFMCYVCVRLLALLVEKTSLPAHLKLGASMGVHIIPSLPQETCLCMYRGRRAVEEATQRLSRAMDRADAELGAAQRNQRGSRYSHYGANGTDRQPANGLNGQAANGHNGVHKLGRAAEHDYDR